ncbi:MAG: hypothetical protein KAT10_01190 [Sulfurimonas sp.]|nr:hypothetical protein [Sulfurimonas sp.]
MNNKLITEEFLDTYEGEVLFLSQDLEEIVQDMQNKNFTPEIFKLLEQKLNDVSDVFLSSTYTQHVSPIFKEFANFISTIESEEFIMFDDAIEYLCEIVSDINTYINFYFVDRIFSDVYLFQDSLQNSIEFLKRAYSCDLGNCNENDGSELDFF